MYSTITTAMIDGISTIPVSVEVDISTGMPMFDMVGFLSSEVREAKERVRTALHSNGILLPAKRITVNLSPGNVKKTGTAFDLPIAVALLSSMGLIMEEVCSDIFFVGELSLKGNLLPVRGILPMLADAKDRGINTFIVPLDNYKEAKLVKGVEVFAFENLGQMIDYLNGGNYQLPVIEGVNTLEEKREVDFADINGQAIVRRACEVAAAGMHNLLMIGPPGAGKTMISERMATILPPLSEEECLEISKIYSVCGMLKNTNSLITKRPFRSPHHTITKIGLAGGGAVPRPGEISLAHTGVLFLDELPEFQKQTLEIMRQPLEDGKVNIIRNNSQATYPSDFLLLCSMNPCNCGYFPDTTRCRCTPDSIKRYLNHVSQPLIDRIDICVETPALSFAEITGKQNNESSEDIRKRVLRCHEIQMDRYRKEEFFHNSKISSSLIPKYCYLGKKETEYMQGIYTKLGLTGRTYHKILKVARTIADLEGKEQIGLSHLMEAVCYRSIDNKYWGGGAGEI